MWTAVTNRLFRLTMFWGGTLPLPYDPAYDASSWRWRIKSEANTSCHLCTSGGGGEEWCEASHQPAGVERGGDRQRALPLPLQHRPLPGRQTHHIRSGTSWVSNLNDNVWIGRRFDCFYPDGKHGLCSGCWSKHDPPQCTCCYGHPHLSTLLIIQVFVAGPRFLCSDFHPLAHEFAGQ